jgi:hypothetical protein
MNKKEKYLLNGVNLFLCTSAEKKCILESNKIITMFAKIFSNDLSYMKLCPDGLEQDLQILAQEIYKNQTEAFKQNLKVLLTCFYDEIRYDMCLNTDMSDKQKDMIWFKALIARRISFNMLAEYGSDKGEFNNFKEEHLQLGSLLSRYYAEADSSKAEVIKNIIKSKTAEFYKRYHISFAYPKCIA